MDTLKVIIQLMGGLGLFIYGMKLMGDGLENAAGEGLKRILEKVTSNRLLGVGIGAIVTAVIQSEKEFVNKKNQDINISNVKYVHDNLIKIKDSIKIQNQSDLQEAAVTLDNNSKKAKIINQKYKIDCSRNSYNIYKIVNNIVEKNYLSIGNYVQKKNSNLLGEESKKIFWTWMTKKPPCLWKIWV